MIDLYGMGSPNVVKVILALEEMGLDYDFHYVNVIEGQQFTPEFIAKNPNSKVPVLVDRRDPVKPVTVFESGAIALYLAETTGLFWPTDIQERYRVIEWVFFQMANFGPISGQALHFSRAIKTEAYAQQRFSNELHRLVGVLESQLQTRSYIAGETYSLADMMLLPWIRILRMLSPGFVDHELIHRWLDHCESRPAARRTFELADQIGKKDREFMGRATPDMWDRYFGRVPTKS